MTISTISSYSVPDHPSQVENLISELPWEGISFIVAAVAVKIFSQPPAYVLMGIGISLIVENLVIKAFNNYNEKLIIFLKKEACKFNKKHPKLQTILLIFALAISFISKSIGFLSGILLGALGSLSLDIEKYKTVQLAKRKH